MIRETTSLSATAFLTVLIALTGTAYAQGHEAYGGNSEWKPTDAEVARLPPYCQADLRPGQYPGPGTSAYGCGEWFNHFCPGLTAMSRVSNPTLPSKSRKYYLQLAEGHFRYTRSRLAPTCRLESELRGAEMGAAAMKSLLR